MVRRTNPKEIEMKRIVIASLLGLIALPALADSFVDRVESQPFEQTQFDRTLPTVAEAPTGDSTSVRPFDDHNRYNP
jgi:hypothetical protein